jgi:hypothetical protein
VKACSCFHLGYLLFQALSLSRLAKTALAEDDSKAELGRQVAELEKTDAQMKS